ncbi:NAD(+)/NADH kinase [Haloprofundus sp. MHR1]|uniref:NAD(+)/NADH kinase n=1 Tax=Haloprofundus sp. MHR1 TaxID=2572921 RepID=UPI0010BF5455|nr:NAD(+)/NADH kinase [Haloprofundus sp. MHR1]QCJ47645.1 NAD(+)/NADH kinase [Haloprofundus sp. MHR1]
MSGARDDTATAVSLRGDDDGRVERALRAAEFAFSDPEEASFVVAVGERALVDAVRERPNGPILPVGVGGRHSVSPSALDDAFAALAETDRRTVDHPLLSVTVGDERVADAVFDAMLVTNEPARISEYAVRSGDDPLDAFRADGVVVATPLGSSGYARAAGGPVLTPGTGLGVVPVSPFSTRWDSWVVDGAVSLSVERDEGAVSLVVDGDRATTVDPHVPVRIEPSAEATLLRPPTPE